jgi:hypothetical protein
VSLSHVLIVELHGANLLLEIGRVADDVDTVADRQLAAQLDPRNADISKPMADFADKLL